MSEIRLIKTKINTLAKIQFAVEESTGEIVPQLTTKNKKEHIKEVKLLLDQKGRLIYPQSLYIMSKLRGEYAVKETKTHEQALLLYTRWLKMSGMSYTDLTEYEEEGAPWAFTTFLLNHIRKRNPDGSMTAGAYAVSTARSYASKVVDFYKWLDRDGYLPFSESRVVCYFYQTIVPLKEKSRDRMLSHTEQSSQRQKTTNSILSRFPKVDSTPAEKKLKPMTPEDEAIFDEYVDKLESPFPLMFRLAKSTGTRIYELATFPAANFDRIVYEGLEEVEYHISPDNGCHTKYLKPRNIEIPVDIIEELEMYYYSDERARNLEKGKEDNEPIFLSDKGEHVTNSVLAHLETEGQKYKPFFLSNKGKSYATNTIEKEFEKLRNLIRVKHPDWYYRVHDLRSTFGTNWMDTEAEKRDTNYDYLLDELAQLMGHSDTSSTEKYRKCLKKRKSQLDVAKNKNNRIQGTI